MFSPILRTRSLGAPVNPESVFSDDYRFALILQQRQQIQALLLHSTLRRDRDQTQDSTSYNTRPHQAEIRSSDESILVDVTAIGGDCRDVSQFLIGNIQFPKRSLSTVVRFYA